VRTSRKDYTEGKKSRILRDPKNESDRSLHFERKRGEQLGASDILNAAGSKAVQISSEIRERPSHSGGGARSGAIQS